MAALVHPNKRLNAAEAAELVAAYEAGGTVRGVAREFGVHHQTARSILDRAGVARRKRVPLSQDDVVEAVRLYESGLSIMQVAEQFDQKYQSMRQALLRAGVVMRPASGAALGSPARSWLLPSRLEALTGTLARLKPQVPSNEA